MLKNKCSVWKRIKFPTLWYNCYYFTWSVTYFIQLETLLINHPTYHCRITIGKNSITCVKAIHKQPPESNTALVPRKVELYFTYTNCQILPNEYDKEQETHSNGSKKHCRQLVRSEWEQLSYIQRNEQSKVISAWERTATNSEI